VLFHFGWRGKTSGRGPAHEAGSPFS
jgi:hypothetical protein